MLYEFILCWYTQRYLPFSPVQLLRCSYTSVCGNLQKGSLFLLALSHQAHVKLSIWTTLAHGHHDPQIFFFIIGYGCSRVKTYSLQSLSVINPKIPIFLNLQRALSQLPSFIRSAAGQAVFSLQVLLQTSLCDRRCRTDICVLICLSLLPLCLPLLHTLHQEGCFH